MVIFNNAFANGEIEVGISTTQEATETPEAVSSLMNFVPLIVIFAIFYFLIIRPQQKKVKEHEQMLSSIKKGDKVSMAGGLIGVVCKIDNTAMTLAIQIADGVEVKVLKSSVTEIINRSHNDKK